MSKYLALFGVLFVSIALLGCIGDDSSSDGDQKVILDETVELDSDYYAAYYIAAEEGVELTITIEKISGEGAFDVMLMDSDSFDDFNTAWDAGAGLWTYYEEGSSLSVTQKTYKWTTPKAGFFYIVIENANFTLSGATPSGTIGVHIQIETDSDNAYEGDTSDEGTGSVINYYNNTYIIDNSTIYYEDYTNCTFLLSVEEGVQHTLLKNITVPNNGNNTSIIIDLTNMTIVDVCYVRVLTPSVGTGEANDLIPQYSSDNGATWNAIDSAEYSWLVANPSPTPPGWSYGEWIDCSDFFVYFPNSSTSKMRLLFNDVTATIDIEWEVFMQYYTFP